jgi:hypothetical protein
LIPIQKLKVERHAFFFYVTLPPFWVFVFLCGSHLVSFRNPLLPFERTDNRRPRVFFNNPAPLFCFSFSCAADILFLPATPYSHLKELVIGPCAFSFFYTASLLVFRFQFAAAIFIPF